MPMPNVMAALPNIGGASVQRRKVWLTPTTRMPCSNAAKSRNPLKFAGVPQTNERISADSGPKFPILWGHVGEILLFNKFFRLPKHALVAKPDKLCDGARWRIFGDFFASCISASRVQQVSDLHPKFALRPHQVSKYGRHPICGRWD